MWQLKSVLPGRPFLTICVLVLTLQTGCLHAQTYQEDLTLIAQPKKPFIAIGNLGPLTQIFDLRGFIPLSTKVKEGWKPTDNQTAGLIADNHRWFKYPLKQGIREIYYGANTADPSFERLPIFGETQLSAEAKLWAGFAYYEICAKNGKTMYEQIGGNSNDYQQAEPVTILMTENSVFLVINFRYQNQRRHGTGQALVAYEFSRNLKAPKAYYPLYTTFLLEAATRNKWEGIAPLLVKISMKYFSVGL